MLYNYHTHTYRCGHATGSEEEYVKKGIENGVKNIGFSEHMPLRFSDGSESSFRLPVCDAEDYTKTIKTLGEKYKDKVNIKVGFEMEYYPECFEKMLNDAVSYGAEYLILGQHYLCPENTNPAHTSMATDSLDVLEKYVDLIISAMRKNVYTYVAHPDVLNFTGDVKVYQETMRKICVESRNKNIPLEINFMGIRNDRNYPNDAFWQIVGEEKSPVTFGFDAHDVESAFDKESICKAYKMVKKFDLNYIGAPDLISIAKK